MIGSLSGACPAASVTTRLFCLYSALSLTPVLSFTFLVLIFKAEWARESFTSLLRPLVFFPEVQKRRNAFSFSFFHDQTSHKKLFCHSAQPLQLYRTHLHPSHFSPDFYNHGKLRKDSLHGSRCPRSSDSDSEFGGQQEKRNQRQEDVQLQKDCF
jgi:hypothetical protein